MNNFFPASRQLTQSNKKKIGLFLFSILLLSSSFSFQGVNSATTIDTETLDYLFIRILDKTVPQVIKYPDQTYLIYPDFEFTRIISPMFVGLYSPDWKDKQSFEPILAKEAPTVRINDNPDYEMTVVVKLKPNLRFSDGSPLTADDVVYSYQAAINREINIVPVYLKFENASQIVKVDDTTIEFNFKKKTSAFMNQLLQWIISKNGVERLLSSLDPRGEWESQFYNYLVGAGSYKVATFDIASKEFVFEYNDNWRYTGFARPEFDRIVFHSSQDKSQAQIQEQILEGLYDIVDPIIAGYSGSSPMDPGNFSVYDESYSFVVHSLAINQIHPVWGHTAQLSKFVDESFTNSTEDTFTVRSFWDNISNHQMTEEQRIKAALLVRQAMKIATNSVSLPDYVLSKMFITADSVFSPVLRGYEQPAQTPKDLDSAYSLIQEAFKLAGWNNITLPNSSIGIPVDQLWKHFSEWNITAISYSSGPVKPQYLAALFAEAAFSKIGFNVLLKFHDIISFFNRVFHEISEAQYSLSNGLHTPIPLYMNGGYDVAYYFALSPFFEWEPNFFESYAFFPVGFNMVNYWDDDYDQLMAKYLAELDYEKRKTLATTIQTKLDSSLPILPFLYRKLAILRQKSLTGLDLPVLDLNLQRWWDLSIPTNKTSDGQKFGDAFRFFRISYPSLGVIVLGIIALIPGIKRRQRS